MIGPDDRDETVRNLLRQPRPEAVDAARAARVRRAVHEAWRDAADGTRIIPFCGWNEMQTKPPN